MQPTTLNVTPFAFAKARYGVSPETHVVLPLERTVGFDSAGRRVNFPKPNGMSGGPVTVLCGDGTGESPVFPVVAVGIEYRQRQNVLIATDVKYVLGAIANAA